MNMMVQTINLNKRHNQGIELSLHCVFKFFVLAIIFITQLKTKSNAHNACKNINNITSLNQDILILTIII